MPETRQSTIARTVSLEGRGLFMGEKATVRFKPAPENHGVVFVRTDISEGGRPVEIPALVHNVTKRARRTTLRRGAVAIETCEHCLSAVAGLNIDNLIIEVHGPELPAGDGSAQPYIDVLQDAGIKEQDEPQRVFKIDQPITVEDGDSMLAALPADRPGIQVIYDLDYGDEGPIRRQLYAFSSDNGRYIEQIGPARTYVLASEAEALQQRGLGTHLTPDEVLVISDEGEPLGSNAFRYDDEPVRHKILDVLGDLFLLGCRINGRIVAYKSGHSLNHQLARQLHKHMLGQRRRDLLLSEGPMDIKGISRILPHRYPMLMVDRIIDVDGDRLAIGVKNVTINEPFFQGHYPNTPIMPGVLIVEAMAQMSGILLSRKLEHTGKLAVLLSMDKVKLRKPVTPGDQLVIEAESIRVRSRTGHTRCRAFVGKDLAAEAQIKFMLVDAEQES